MKANKIVYWASTSIVSLMMTFSAYMYLSRPEMKEGFHHLGFPDYFRIELGIAKLLGAVLLLAPVAARVKEWVYAGFAITFVSAIVSHAASGDPVQAKIMPAVFLALLIVSYVTNIRRKAVQKSRSESLVSERLVS